MKGDHGLISKAHRRLSAIPLVACLILPIMPALAAPSTAGDDAPLQSSGLVSQPVIQGRNWRLTGSVRTLHDSNFRRLPAPESAVRVSPLATASVGLPIGRQQLYVGADIGRDIFLGKTGFDRNRYRVGGGLAWRLGNRCTGSLVGEYTNRLSQTSDLAEFVDNVQETKVFGASANCQSAVGLGFGGSVRHNIIDNQRLQRSAFDLRSTVISPQISYGRPSLGQFSLSGSLTDLVYPNRQVLTGGGPLEDRLKIYNARLGYQRSFGTRIQLTAGLSFNKVNPDPTSQLVVQGGQLVSVARNGFTGSGYDLSLGLKPSNRLSLTLVGNRDVTATPNVGAAFVVNQQYGLDMNYSFGRALTFGLGGTRNVRSYRGGFATTDERLVRVRDEVNRVYAQLDYQPVPLYAVGVEVAHQKRNSNPADFNYSSTTATLNLRVKLGRG